MKYQLVEYYTDVSGVNETYRSKKYATRKEAQKEESFLMKNCPQDEWLATHWEIEEVED